MTYGDGVADINLTELLNFHLNHGKIATVRGVHAASRLGALKIEGDNVVSVNEKPPFGEGLVNGGFFVLNRHVFDYVCDDDDCVF